MPSAPTDHHDIWRVEATRTAYTSPWVDVRLDDVRLPDGNRIEHHAIRFPKPAVGAVVVDDREHTLLLWRHRYITDTWGWEIPAGWADPDEDPQAAACREVEEETGYRPVVIQKMVSYKTMPGISEMRYTMFVVTEAVRVGEPTDLVESSRLEWVPLADIGRLTDAGDITDGPTLVGLSYYLGVHRSR